MRPVVLDRWLKTRVFRRQAFWILIVAMTVCQLIVNGYLTSRPVFLYGARFISGLRIGTIPVEDFIFAFAFISFVIILWECYKRKEAQRSR